MTLAEQLDSLLFGWLEQRADTGPPRRADARGTAVVAVTERLVPDVEAFCARWNLGVRVRPADTGHWAVLRVDGPSLPVEGLAADHRAVPAGRQLIFCSVAASTRERENSIGTGLPRAQRPIRSR